jgi:hypothetical protein
LILVFLARLSEAPCWLISKGRFDRAEKIIRTIEASRPSTDQLPAPDGLKLLHGQGSGSVVVRIRRLNAAISDEVQATQNDPKTDAGGNTC